MDSLKKLVVTQGIREPEVTAWTEGLTGNKGDLSLIQHEVRKFQGA